MFSAALSTDAGGRPPAVALGRKRRARAGATNYATRTTVPGLLPLGARAVYAGNSNAPPARGAAHRPHPPAGWRGRWAVRVASPSRLPWGAYNWALRLRTEASSERQERRGSRRSGTGGGCHDPQTAPGNGAAAGGVLRPHAA